MELLNKIERPIDSKSKSLRKLNKSFRPILEYLNNLKEKNQVE